MLQENIKKIEEYFKSIEINEGVLIVRVNFKDKWGVYPSKDGKIKVVNSKNNKNEWMYYGQYSDVTIDEMFNLIDETIKMNVEAGLKIDLLSSKFDELKQLFSTESLDKLKTLTFVFNDSVDIKPKKRKYVRKKKIVEIKETLDKPSIENNEEKETIE